MYRLTAGTTALAPLAGAPAHPQLLYRTGGWVVAAMYHTESGEQIRESVVSVSPDGGSTWRVVPGPA